MPAILFAAESDQSRSLPLSAQRLVNFFSEKERPGSKSQTPLFGAPGMSAFANTASITGAIAALGAVTGGSGYVSGVYTNVPLTGGSGSGAIATISVSGGAVSAVVITIPGINYQVGDVLSALSTNLGGNGSGFSTTVATLNNRGIAALGATTTLTATGAPNLYYNVPLTGGSGSGALATVQVGYPPETPFTEVVAVNITNPGINYQVGDLLSGTAGGNFTVPVAALAGGGVATIGSIIGGSGYTASASTYNNVPLTGGSGTGVTGNITVTGGSVSAVAVNNPGINYLVGDTLSGLSGGSIASFNNLVGGSGYTSGTYTAIPLTGGSGTGGVATITINGTIATLGAITGGSGYDSGGTHTYTAVPLTGGAGSGAQATIVVTSGVVTAVTLTLSGTDYQVGDVLSANNANLGGSGSGFSIPVAALSGTGAVTAVTITAGGVDYEIGEVLSAANSNFGGVGSGFSITILTLNGVGSGFSVPVAALNTIGPIRGSWVKSDPASGQEIPYVVAGNSLYQLSQSSAGTYYGVPLTGGSGSGAAANIVVLNGAVTTVTLTANGNNYQVGDLLSAPLGGGTGFLVPVATLSSPVIALLGAVIGGAGYVSGTYYGVPLTGGSGSGATATVTVTNGAVSAVQLATAGTGYVIGDVLSASNANLGGAGSGFSVSVAQISGPVATLGAVIGGSNYQVGSCALVGSGISGTDIVGMSDNGFQLCIVSGQAKLGWILDTNPQSATFGFRQITDPNFYPANTVSFFDGYFVFDRIGTNEFFVSNLYDGTTYNGLLFASAESQPDFVTGTVQNLQLLFVICQQHLELWYDAGNAPPTFPFQRYTGSGISYGCISPHTIIKQDGAIFFLGSDKIFYRLQSTVPIRVSTHAMEHIIAQDTNITEAYCFTYTLEGHKFVVLQLPASQRTLIFDISTNRWAERESWDANNNSLGSWRASTAFSAFNNFYLGDGINSNVNLLDWTTYTELGNTIRGLAYSIPYHQDRKRLFVSRFELDIQAGVGMPFGPGSNPQIELGWSVDGANTFKPLQFWRSMGMIGQYLIRLRWLRMGQGRQFVFMISCTDPVPRVIIAAHADISIGM